MDFNWSQEHNTDFFNHIEEEFSKDGFLDEENIAEIEQAFKEYFEAVGYIVFELKDECIDLRVLPYETEPKDSVNLDDIIDIINENEDFIEYNYRGNENQILIKEELRDEIFDFASDIDNEEINKKELIKYSFRKALELDETDIIVVKKGSMFIKLLSKLKRKYVSKEGKSTLERRFNGIDEDELVSFYEEYFSHDNKNFFTLVAKLFVDRYFIEEKIDNAEYEKNVFAYIHGIIIEQLVETFDHNKEFSKGFAGYIFRIHFQEVFTHISELIFTKSIYPTDIWLIF